MAARAVLKPAEVMAILERLGFADVSPILLRQIARDIGLIIEES